VPFATRFHSSVEKNHSPHRDAAIIVRADITSQKFRNATNSAVVRFFMHENGLMKMPAALAGKMARCTSSRSAFDMAGMSA
jgi:hypothetical protein